MTDFKDDCTDDLVNRLTLRGSLNSALEVECLREIEFLHRKRGALIAEGTRKDVVIDAAKPMLYEIQAQLEKHDGWTQFEFFNPQLDMFQIYRMQTALAALASDSQKS